MKNRFSTHVWGIGLLLLVGLFSCQTKVKKKVIGFSQCTSIDLWRQEMEMEMKRAISLHAGYELIIKSAGADTEQQRKDIDELIAKKVDLLIVSPNESTLSKSIDKAARAGIPVIELDRQTNSESVTCFIGANNYDIGKMAASHLLEIAEFDTLNIHETGLKES
ncbi:MAG: substrate-binding domain-containing protein [Bacteroidetes bacterium]|nr:substrate-binding domain-containing protein [Bacteroidota bacterium]